MTRRALLSATGAGALLAIAGCNPFSSAPQTITVTKEATPTTQPPAQSTPAIPPEQTATTLLGLIFTTRLHVQHLTSAVDDDTRDAKVLAMLLPDRQAHLAALEKEYERVVGKQAPTHTSAGETETETGTDRTSDPDEVMGVIRGDATTAQNKFTDALAGASRYQAQLYGAIAACVATHRRVLS